jgi:hypothetical protein
VASDVPSTAVSGTVTAATDDRITVTVGYDDALAVLGMIDGGSWDLYATRTTIGGDTETVYIGSGNLRIALASNVVSAYSIGSS